MTCTSIQHSTIAVTMHPEKIAASTCVRASAEPRVPIAIAAEPRSKRPR